VQKKWGDKGLTILGVTNGSEPKDKTEAFIANTEAAYGYAYDPGGALSRYFGVRGIPSAVLVDASGTVLWTGHPGSLPEAQIANAVQGALQTPIWEWPESADKVAKELRKRRFAKALEEARELDDDAVAKSVQAMIDGALKGLERAHEAGDYLAAVRLGERLEDWLDDLPEEERVKAILEKIDDDDRAQDILDAQEKIAKMKAGRIKKGKIDRMIRDLEKIREELPDTVAARQAADFIAALKQMK
jgi:hypothetical protein